MCFKFSKEREGRKICNFSLELLQGKRVGKSLSQIMPQNVQKVHMLYFEKMVWPVNSALDMYDKCSLFDNKIF
jgi:hypothetical protein